MTEILITSSVLILALLAMRKLFRNSLSRRIQYALWGLVLLRLLAPVSLPAVDFSVLTAAKPVEQTMTQRMTARPIYVPVSRAPRAEHPAAPDTAPEQTETPVGESVWVAQNEQTAVQYKRLSVQTVLSWVWLAGSGVAAAWLLAANIRFWLRLRRTRKRWDVEGCALPVYLVETGLSSPCLFGLFQPAIYLTPAALASPERLRHVLAHETTHARHLDHLWTLLRGVCLAVYWFDPLVWIASSAVKTDCELACDEGTLARLEETDRIPYGQTLLSLIPVQRTASPMLAATTMAAGKKQLKDRITRIAQRRRQFVAAAVAAALLAGLVSACTFTGAVSPAGSGSDQPDAGPRALVGEELLYFNEVYFNSGEGPEYATSSDGRRIYYNIRSQFANPVILYEKPEDIDLRELFYIEGTTEFSDEEYRAAFDMEPGEMPCAVYKLTAGEMDQILTRYTGLTLEQTNKVNLEQFNYLPEYDAYYWGHGDTNYCGYLDFVAGTRDGNIVTLYQDSYFVRGWYRVTLEEQEDGSYHFLSNQKCEKPAIPTPLPAGEPETVISLDNVELYELAPGGAAIESRKGDYDGSPENRLGYWYGGDPRVVLYRAGDGTVNAAIWDEETGVTNVFLSDIGEDAVIDSFDGLFGYSGFTVTYRGQISETPRSFGAVVDYYFFARDGVLELLARSAETVGESPRVDLDGDGQDELISVSGLIFQGDDGWLYRADIYDLVLDSCEALDYWDYCTLDRYSKCLSISGLSHDDVGRSIFRWLYFDGEQLLLYKREPVYHDHMVDGADKNVPADVLAAARDFVQGQFDDMAERGFGVDGSGEDFGPGNVVWDDWRITELAGPYYETVGDRTVEIWSVGYETHTATPDRVVLAGGSYIGEDDWCMIGYYGCDVLFFQVEGENRILLWHDMINDMGPGTERFYEYLAQKLNQPQ